jgi:hypothetical protein
MKAVLDMAAIETTILDDAGEHEEEREACESPEGDQIAELSHTVLCERCNAWICDKCSQLLGIAEDGESLVEDLIQEGVGDDQGWIRAVSLALY